MRKRSFWTALFLSLLLTLSSGGLFFGGSLFGGALFGGSLFSPLPLRAQTPPIAPTAEEASAGGSANTSGGPPAGAPSAGASSEADFDEIVEPFEKLPGLMPLYRDKKKNRLLAEVRPDQLNRNYLLVTTLSQGVGEFGLYRGMPLQDFPFTLRQVDTGAQKTLQLVVPNFYFRANRDDARQSVLRDSFSDSVLYSLPVVATQEKTENRLVDLAPLFVGQPVALEALAPFLQILGYGPNQEQFALQQIQNLEQNIEIDATYGFSGGNEGGWLRLSSLANPGGLSLGVHYSLSELPWDNGYQPRLADERVGYFVTAFRDVSAREQRDPFVRYIDRWFLEKADPKAELSPPKQPIVFWIENTVPLEYRDAFREGALMWNSAFEKAGFKDAIEVRQMPDDADWDPADVRYNTLRWFDSVDGSFALGPRRVNPYTGQILDGDVLVGSEMVRFDRAAFEVLSSAPDRAIAPPALAQALGEQIMPLLGLEASCPAALASLPLLPGDPAQAQNSAVWRSPGALPALPEVDEESFYHSDRCFAAQTTEQYAYGAMALASLRQVLPSSDTAKDYQHQYLRDLVAHEVGHLLGLRHNFQGSHWLSPEELHDRDVTRRKGLVASIMDYVPVNLAPDGVEQGDYFPQRVGPYDEWAIEYGYTPLEARSVAAERRALEAIASRAAEPGLAYAPDEDTTGLDPRVRRFDLSNDPLTYSHSRIEQTRRLWEKLNRQGPGPGKSYSDLRLEFNLLLSHHANQLLPLANYIGGRQFNRYRAGDAPDQLPLSPVPIEQQRRALELIVDNLLDDRAMLPPSELLNKLPPARWLHWGRFPSRQLDFPLYDEVSFYQSLALGSLLSSDRLARLRDAELRPSEANLSLSELFSTLHDGIWKPSGSEKLSLIQRGLQRQHLKMLSDMTLRNAQAVRDASSFLEFILAIQALNAPDDARALARLELEQIREEVKAGARRSRDRITQAHYRDIEHRIEKVLAAPLIGS